MLILFQIMDSHPELIPTTIYHELTIVVTKRLGEILTPAIFALISIFGNVHRPCKYYSNIVKNSLHHVYSFFFLSFLAIFVENYQIWKCAQTDHVNSSPTTSPIVSTILISFSDVIA